MRTLILSTSLVFILFFYSCKSEKKAIEKCESTKELGLNFFATKKWDPSFYASSEQKGGFYLTADTGVFIITVFAFPGSQLNMKTDSIIYIFNGKRYRDSLVINDPLPGDYPVKIIPYGCTVDNVVNNEIVNCPCKYPTSGIESSIEVVEIQKFVIEEAAIHFKQDPGCSWDVGFTGCPDVSFTLRANFMNNFAQYHNLGVLTNYDYKKTNPAYYLTDDTLRVPAKHFSGRIEIREEDNGSDDDLMLPIININNVSFNNFETGTYWLSDSTYYFKIKKL